MHASVLEFGDERPTPRVPGRCSRAQPAWPSWANKARDPKVEAPVLGEMRGLERPIPGFRATPASDSGPVVPHPHEAPYSTDGPDIPQRSANIFANAASALSPSAEEIPIDDIGPTAEVESLGISGGAP